MSRPLHHQIVARAREIIADRDHWTQGELAVFRDGRAAEPTHADAYAFCAVGALQRAAHELSSARASSLADQVQMLIESFAATCRDPNTDFSLEILNDDNGHAAVLLLFDHYLAADVA